MPSRPARAARRPEVHAAPPPPEHVPWRLRGVRLRRTQRPRMEGTPHYVWVPLLAFWLLPAIGIVYALLRALGNRMDGVFAFGDLLGLLGLLG